MKLRCIGLLLPFVSSSLYTSAPNPANPGIISPLIRKQIDAVYQEEVQEALKKHKGFRAVVYCQVEENPQHQALTKLYDAKNIRVIQVRALYNVQLHDENGVLIARTNMHPFLNATEIIKLFEATAKKHSAKK